MSYIDFTENGKDYRMITQGPDIESPEGVTIALFYKTKLRYEELFRSAAVVMGEDVERMKNEAKIVMKQHAQK